MNELQFNCSEYVDCNTSKKKRDIIIEKYKNGEIPFLVNVRILVEGFDAPITKGVCFLHLPTNKTTLIQIIGRCLRLHPTKTIANIILPFSSKEDEKNICNFLKVMAKNDSWIRKSFENKTLGGYISIENLEENNDEENEDIEFKYNMIYDSMGFLKNGIEIWIKRLEEVKKYIDENSKRPNIRNKYKKTKNLCSWISNQQQKYKNKIQIMKNEEIHDKWSNFINDDKYKIYFSVKKDFNNLLQELIQYININNKRPNKRDIDNKIKKLGVWTIQMHKYYKMKKYIMSNKKNYNKWTEFINNTKYKIYFQSLEDVWFNNLKQVEDYIIKNNIRPSQNSKDNDIKQLANWIRNQQTKYKNKDGVMENTQIYNKWTEIINSPKYKKYLQSNDKLWYDTFQDVIQYIHDNNIKPNSNDKDIKTKQLGQWIITQQTNYKKKDRAMKNEEIYNKWNEFINDPKYINYFQSLEDNWMEIFNKVIQYIDINNKRPCQKDKDKIIKTLGQWISNQSLNYKKKEKLIKNEEIYNKWTNFINDPKYNKYFLKD